MSRRIVLLRHGQTAWNIERRGQGHTDVPLDQTGHAQAVQAAPWIASFQPSMLWSSDLSRARQTAGYVGGIVGIAPVIDARLREFDLGERTGMRMADFAVEHPEEYAALQAGDFTAVPGAERAEQVAERVGAALDDVRAQLRPDGTAVVVSHGSAIKVAVAVLAGWPTHTRAFKGLPNCGAAVLEEHAEGGFRLEAYGLVAPPDFSTA